MINIAYYTFHSSMIEISRAPVLFVYESSKCVNQSTEEIRGMKCSDISFTSCFCGECNIRNIKHHISFPTSLIDMDRYDM